MIFQYNISLENCAEGSSDKQVRELVKKLRADYGVVIVIDSLDHGFVRTNDCNVAMLLKLTLD